MFFWPAALILIFWYTDCLYIFGFGCRSPVEEEDEAHISHTAPELRDVFGDSDDEEPEYAVENQIDHDSNVSMRFQLYIFLSSLF